MQSVGKLSLVLARAKAWIIRKPLKAALLAALLVASPTVFSPFWPIDDYTHQIALHEYFTQTPAKTSPHLYAERRGFIDLFQFFTGVDGNRVLIARGLVPWWTWEGIETSFCRPLSNLLMVVDYALFGRNPIGYHVHSILWYLLFVLSAGSLLRRALPASVAALVVMLFALDAGHAVPVGWTANRNGVIAGALALATVLFHTKAVEDRWTWGRVLAVPCLMLALAAGEIGLGAYGFLLAFEVLGNSDAGSKRLVRLVPYGLVAIAYVIAYKLGGYGTTGSGLYIDPMREKAAFLVAWLARFPVLVATQLAGLPLELWMLRPSSRPWLWGSAVLVVTAAAWLLRIVWPTLQEKEKLALRWIGPGALLAVCPAVAVMPTPRLLLLPSVGGAVVSGFFLRWGVAALEGWRKAPLRQRLRGIVGMGVAFRHVACCPGIWWIMIPLTLMSNQVIRRAIDTLELDPSRSPHESLLVLAASDPSANEYLPPIARWDGKPIPFRWYRVSAAASAHRLTRTTRDTVELETVSGSIVEGPYPQQFRSSDHPIIEGQIVKTDIFDVCVARVRDGRVEKISLRFPCELEYCPIRMVAWENGRFVHVAPPPMGQSVVLRWFPGPTGS